MALLVLYVQLRDVRRELQDVLHERDVAVARGAKVEDLEETVSELRRQNKELEDQASGTIRAKAGGRRWGAGGAGESVQDQE